MGSITSKDFSASCTWDCAWTVFWRAASSSRLAESSCSFPRMVFSPSLSLATVSVCAAIWGSAPRASFSDWI